MINGQFTGGPSEILRESSAMKCNVNGSIYRVAEEVMWNKLVGGALFI